MTESDARAMVEKLARLFPQHGDRPPIDPVEVPLFRKVFRPHPVDRAEAAIEAYKCETKRARPIIGEVRAMLANMATNARGYDPAAQKNISPAEFFRRQWKRDDSTLDAVMLFDAHLSIIRRCAEVYGPDSHQVESAIRQGKNDYATCGISEYADGSERRWRESL